MTRSEHLHAQIMALIHGERAGACSDALCRSIAAVVLVASGSKETAEKAIVGIAEVSWRYVEAFWEHKDEIDKRVAAEQAATTDGPDKLQ